MRNISYLYYIAPFPRFSAKEGRFVRGSQLELADQQAVRGWLKGFPSEVLFVRRVFTNKDGSIGQLNLVCSDLTRNGEQVATI